MAEGSERSLKMLAAALEKEEKGRDFYRDAAAKCANERSRQTFLALTSEEGVHITRIKEIYASLTGGKAWSKEWQAHRLQSDDLQKLVADRSAKLDHCVPGETTELEAVEMGIGMEQGSIAFYNDQKAKATDALETEFIDQMIAEERTHLRSLEDLKLFLTDPDSWYLETERHGLDGG